MVGRAPGYWFTLVTVIGLGVGANAAVFDVLDRLLVRSPAEVAAPDQLRRLAVDQSVWQGPRRRFNLFSAPDLMAATEAFGNGTEVAGYHAERTRRVDNAVETLNICYSSVNFFRVVGTRTTVGRGFNGDEGIYRDPRRVAVISHSLWRSRYGGELTVLGRAIRLDSTDFIIVGVAAPAFIGIDVDPVDIWLPLPTLPNRGEGDWFEQSGTPRLSLIVRSVGGPSTATVSQQLTASFRRLHRADDWFDFSAEIVLDPLQSSAGLLSRGEISSGSLSLIERLTVVAILILLLTACNIGGLQLMKVASRRSEFAIRLALGTNVWRLARQLFTESCVAAAAGFFVALIVASTSSGLLRGLLFSNIRWQDHSIDKRITILVLVSVTFVAILAALAPMSTLAWKEASNSLAISPADEHRNATRIRSLLLVFQTSLSFVLLVAAGAFVVSLFRASKTDLGIDSARLITVDTRGFGLTEDRAAVQRNRLLALPFVDGVARSDADVRPGSMRAPFQLPGSSSINAQVAPSYNAVEPSFLEIVGLQIQSGRPFNNSDVVGNELVAIVSQSMANAYWHDGRAVGSCFYAGSTICRRVVGVVEDVRWGAHDLPKPHYYLPLGQVQSSQSGAVFVIRTKGTITATELAAVRRVTSTALAATEGSAQIRAVADRLDSLLRPLQLASRLFVAFGLLALVSALAGIFGTVAYDATRRSREIGIRLALGAQPQVIVLGILRAVITWIVAGVAVGGILLAAVWPWLSTLVLQTFSVTWIALPVAALLVAVGCLAALLPARRASRTDPRIAMATD